MKGWLTASQALVHHIASVYYWPDHTNAYTSSAFPRCKHWGVFYLTQLCIHGTTNDYFWRLTNLKSVAFIYEINIKGCLWNIPVFKLEYVCVCVCVYTVMTVSPHFSSYVIHMSCILLCISSYFSSPQTALGLQMPATEWSLCGLWGFEPSYSC